MHISFASSVLSSQGFAPTSVSLSEPFTLTVCIASAMPAKTHLRLLDRPSYP